MQASLWLLTIANLLNYLDRYIISSVAPKIETEFGLTHAQTGFLMSAFMIGYVVTSPLFGWLGDRKNRPRLMGVGVLVWSVATGFSGWVSSFIPLVLARIMVGIGEASYATITPAYIRDLLKDERLINRAMAFFYTAIPIGAAIGYVFGGSIAEHFNWRWAFYLGAIPGFFLAIFIWRMCEQPRTESGTKRMDHRSGLKSLWTNHDYRLLVLGYTAHTFGLGGFAAWAPHYGANVLKVSLSEASFKIGAVTCIAGVIGTLIGGRWGDRFMNRQEKHGVEAARGFMKFCGLTSFIATPFAFWTLYAGDMNTFIIAMLFVQIAMFAAVAPINTATLASVSPQISATAFAVQILVIHALGDVISPPLVGWLSDRMPMNTAMNILAASIFVSGVVWWHASRESQKSRL